MATEEVFMSVRQYTDEFKAEAIKQVVERGFTVVEVAARIGVPKHTLYGWVQGARKAARTSHAGTPAASDSAEVRRLKAELKRVTEERDILKKAAVGSTGRCNATLGCTDMDNDELWQEWVDLGFPIPRSRMCGSSGGAVSR